MSKRHKEQNKKKKFIFSIILVSIAAFCLAVFFVSHKTLAQSVTGWGAGIWNNYVAGHLEDDPTVPPAIGWLSSSSSLKPCLAGAPYSVYFSSGNPEDDERYVSGKAWFGIGSRSDPDPVNGTCDNDLPSLGWLNFGAGAPPFCSGDDCHAARWHRIGDGYTGYLDGWAQITSMGDNGWTRLKGASYGVRVKADGTVNSESYAWNSGTETVEDYRNPALGGNSGLGWIKMDGLKIVECNLSCATKLLCRGRAFASCDSSFCVGEGASCSLGDDKISWTCTSGCGSISCSPYIIDIEIGQCGELNGKSICDANSTPTADKLCADPATYNNDLNRSAITATWTCGKDQCGVDGRVECSAKSRCGWIETNP